MNEVRKRHNEEKITSGQHFCGKCGSLLSSRGSDCVQCNSNSKEQEMKQNRMTHVKGENKPISSLLSNRLLPIVAVGFVLGLITFFIIGTASAPDVIYIEPDFGDGGYYDDGYYDGGYYDDPLGIMSPGFYGPGNNVECIFEECVPYGTGGW
tara:strand:- start:45 stop:500 length:456 start_codon:yes stop_codon:yes gene_type:complete